jgi:hypothetical protein
VLGIPDQDGLSFSIGGPFASLGWIPSATERRSKGQKEALAGQRYAQQAVPCWSEGIPTDIEPEYLFPVEQAVEALVYFYNTHELPRWITWREWDPDSLQWKVIPAEVHSPQPIATP